MPQPCFTWEELSERNTPECALIAIHGKVYDVTKFLDQHPGGRDQLLVGVGRDASVVFDTYHKESTLKVLEKFYVGELVSNELPTFPEPSPFYVHVRKVVADYFRDTKQDPKHAPWMFVRYFMIVAFFLAGFAGQIVFSDSLALSFLCSGVLGFSAALIGLMPLHDTSHYAITHDPTVWRYVGLLHDFLNGCSSRVWAYQHTLGHHPYTNIDDADPDIMTAAKEVPDIRRIKNTQTWYQRYLSQHVYMPFLYGLLSVKTRVQDFSILFVLKKDGSIRLNPLPARDFAAIISSKVFFFCYRILLPLAFLPVWQTLSLFVFSDLVSSWWLALCFQCSHVVGEVDWPLPDKNGKINMDWAEMQIVTTMDYATKSWFWTFFTGALNHQTTHHLFPGICQYYYPQVTPLVVKACEKYNVRYNSKETFSEALGAHIRHLRELGKSPSRRAQ